MPHYTFTHDEGCNVYCSPPRHAILVATTLTGTEAWVKEYVEAIHLRFLSTTPAREADTEALRASIQTFLNHETGMLERRDSLPDVPVKAWLTFVVVPDDWEPPCL
jgi:hypothetical protein